MLDIEKDTHCERFIGVRKRVRQSNSYTSREINRTEKESKIQIKTHIARD